MFDLAHESFAKHGDNFFLEETGGVLIVSEAVLEKRHKDIQKKKWFLFSKRQKALSALVAQLQPPASFLLTCDLPNETVLLTDQTTVTLSNIEISVKLFFVLLRKTMVTVEEAFSITEQHTDSEDCIREHGMARNSPFWLDNYEAVSILAIENIERMAPNSIGCSLKEVDLSDTGLINILPKLRIHVDSEIEILSLTASEEAHVAEVLKQEKPFCVGRVEDMWLEGYAVGVITKMSLKDCEIEYLSLTASEEAHVAAVLAQKKPFCVGRVKDMRFEEYAVGVITKMSPEDCEIESLRLYAPRKEHVAEVLKQEKPFCVGRVKKMKLTGYAASVITKMSLKDCGVEDLRMHASEEAHVAEVLAQEKPFCVGRVKTMELEDYAVGVITKMGLKDCEFESLSLYANEEAHVAGILKQENPFCVGRVKKMWLGDYAVGVITKMSLKDCEIGMLWLSASEKEHVAAVLEEENPFCVGRVMNMNIWDYAASVITKMTIHEDNTMKSFALDAGRDHLSRILGEGDNSIDLGRIRTGGLRVPEEIKRKLRYTLVDGEGKEVLEEESDEEVLEEEEPSRRGNLLE
ncbi:MAG: uncharacterized protein A8A55_2928 [Amphiamblys sp. WSBS2006]|nr:MAG: uncharacterized protein A8A55_2928 [Amphiamblys sp. WSBS2006]